MGKIIGGQMPLSGNDQRYNNVNSGKVDRVRLIKFRVCVCTKVTRKSGTS
jgi:hypothetical protein